ncbi:sulfotransferase [bacterium]|nr:sulfotransferase [bacterium]
MLPNFIVIGAAKCGTTSICDLLSCHPQIFMSDPKEPHFFGRDDPSKTFQWYEGFFSSVQGEIAVGEGSTSYTHPDIIVPAASEIAEHIPHCRLIYMVRNPIKRLESDWKMRKHEGWAEGTINQAVFAQDTLITHGMYWQNLNVYRKFFADDQILIVFLEDFIVDPEYELERCCRHIGVDPSVSFDNIDKPRNKSDDFRKDGFIAHLLRQTNLLNSMIVKMPKWMIIGAKRVLTRKQALYFEWDDDVRMSVIEKLLDDSRQFLEYCDKPIDFWGLQAQKAIFQNLHGYSIF